MLGPSTSLHSRLHQDDSSSSEDEEERLRREEEEEEEQERLLSRQHGEANETSARRSGGNNNKRSRQQTDAEIANALNSKSSSADQVDASGKKRKKRMVLDEMKLTGSGGLIAIRRGFPLKLRYKDPKKDLMKLRQSRPSSESDRKALRQKQFDMEVNASANYISSLMRAYQNFAMDIAPNMHPTDTFNKIQDLGSRKLVRDYLDNMREEVCRDHMNKIYGKERTQKLMRELEYGMNAIQERLEDENDAPIAQEIDDHQNIAHSKSNNVRASETLGVLVSNQNIPKRPDVQKNDKVTNDREESVTNSEEDEATLDNASSAMTRNISTEMTKNDEDKLQAEEESKAEASFKDTSEEVFHANSKGANMKTRDDDHEDDDEAEATFDDVSMPYADRDDDESQQNTTTGAKAEETKERKTSQEQDENEHDETEKINHDFKGKNEESMIVELSQFEDTDIQDEQSLNASQNVMETQTVVPTMTQASMFPSKSQDQLTFDASQHFEETQTIVPSMTQATSLHTESHDIDASQAFDETQTIVPSMTPSTQRDLDELLKSQEY